MRKGLLFLLILASLNGVAQSYYLWNDKVQKTYESINSLKIPEARKVIEKELNNHTNNLFYFLLESEADLYQLFLMKILQSMPFFFHAFKSG